MMAAYSMPRQGDLLACSQIVNSFRCSENGTGTVGEEAPEA